MTAESNSMQSDSLFAGRKNLLPLETSISEMREHYKYLIQRFSLETIQDSLFHKFIRSNPSIEGQLCVTNYHRLVKQEKQPGREDHIPYFFCLETPWLEELKAAQHLSKLKISLGFLHNQILQFTINHLASLLFDPSLPTISEHSKEAFDTLVLCFEKGLSHLLIVNSSVVKKEKIISLVKEFIDPLLFANMLPELAHFNGLKKDLFILLNQLTALEEDVFYLREVLKELEISPGKLSPLAIRQFYTPTESCARWYSLIGQERLRIPTQEQKKFSTILLQNFNASSKKQHYISDELLSILASYTTVDNSSFTAAFTKWHDAGRPIKSQQSLTLQEMLLSSSETPKTPHIVKKGGATPIEIPLLQLPQLTDSSSSSSSSSPPLRNRLHNGRRPSLPATHLAHFSLRPQRSTPRKPTSDNNIHQNDTLSQSESSVKSTHSPRK